MKNILLGNGINIQFGGLAYSSDFIMKRIKYSARLDRYEMIRLCKAVKEDMNQRNPFHEATDKKNFIQQNASICYIALKEGILPSVLYLICIMNFQYIKD